MSNIPVIDLGRYLDGSDKQGVAAAIGQACEEIGFFTIANHGVDQALIEKANACALDFFQQDHAIKKRSLAKGGMGYIGPDGENLAASLDNVQQQDLKESLNLTLPIAAPIWPDSAELRHCCLAYYSALLTLSRQLMRLFALALGLPEMWFDDKVNEPRTILRLLHYPPVETTATDTTRAGAHTDYGTLTILWSPDSRGLQAQNRAGDWVDVIAPPENLIINIGDLMMNWTNDRWISTLHRVVPRTDTASKRRQSIPFFHNPNPNALIETIETCVGEDNPAKYRPMLAKEHLEMKIAKSLGKQVNL